MLFPQFESAMVHLRNWWRRDHFLFLCLLATALVCHGFIMFNHYPTFSGLTLFINEPMTQVREGRWLAALLMQLNGSVTLPWLTGTYTCGILALSGVLLSKIYRGSAFFPIFLVGSSLITSPVLAGSYTFMYMADVFTTSLFFATLAAYLFVVKHHLPWSIFFLTISMCLYQTYISYAIMLVLLSIVIELLSGQQVKSAVYAIVRLLFVCVASILFYFVTYKASVFFCGINAGNTMTPPSSLAELIQRLVGCYQSFAWFLWGGTVYSRIIARVLLVLEVVVFCLVLVINLFRTSHQRLLRFLCLLAILAVSPIVCFCLCLVSDRPYAYRMCGGCIPLLFLLVLASHMPPLPAWNPTSQPVVKIIGCVASLLTACMCWYQVVANNTSYMNMHLSYEKEYSLAIRIVDRIESSPLYEPGMKVAILQSSHDIYGGTAEVSSLDAYVPGISSRGNVIMGTPTGIKLFIEQFIQTDMNVVDNSGLSVDDPRFLDLGVWPSNDCIGMIDDYLVIRLS